MALSRSSSTSTKSYGVEKTEREWREQLGAEKYRILRQKGTERPGTSKYDKMYPKDGVFRCAGCDHPLYTAGSKFRSNCGWPCFDQVIYTEEGGCHVGVVESHGQCEIVCNNCGGHLGHVFYGEGCTKNNERH